MAPPRQAALNGGGNRSFSWNRRGRVQTQAASVCALAAGAHEARRGLCDLRGPNLAVSDRRPALAFPAATVRGSRNAVPHLADCFLAPALVPSLAMEPSR